MMVYVLGTPDSEGVQIMGIFASLESAKLYAEESDRRNWPDSPDRWATVWNIGPTWAYGQSSYVFVHDGKRHQCFDEAWRINGYEVKP